MTSAGKFVAAVAALMALGAVGLGYWFLSASRPAQTVPQPPAGASPTKSQASAPVGAPANVVDFGPIMAQLDAIQGSARSALQAEHWDEAASLAQQGLKLVESRGGVHEPFRIVFLAFQVEAAAGAKRFPEAAAYIQALLDQMKESPAQWQDYMVTVHRGRAAIAEGQARYLDAADEWGQALSSSRHNPKLARKDIEVYYLASQANALTRGQKPSDAKAVIEAELALPEHNQNDSDRIEFRLYLARRIRDDNLPIAEWLAKDALAIGRKLPDSRLNIDTVEAEAALADIDFRASGRTEPESQSESNPEAAKAMDQLKKQAEELTNAEKPKAALELMAKRLSIAEQADGKDSVVYALSLDEFATTASAAGLVDLGEKAYRQSISIIEAKEGREAYDLTNPLNNLANLLYFGSTDRSSEEEMLWQRSLAICEKYEGPLHYDSLVIRANMGYAQKHLKHWDQAERSFKEAIAIALWHGDESEASSAWFGMFELRRDQDRLSEAEPFVMRSFDLRQHSLGMRHPKTRMTLNNVVWLKRQLGKPQEAVPFLEQLARVEAEIYGPDDMNTFMRQWDLAGLYGEVGDWERADELGRDLESRAAAVYAHPLGEGFDSNVPR